MRRKCPGLKHTTEALNVRDQESGFRVQERQKKDRGYDMELVVYEKAYALSLEMHKLSLSFPKIEQYELASQLRRATKSIALNIAEGDAKRSSKAEFRRYLLIAYGSSREVKVQLRYSKDLEYITEAEYLYFIEKYDEVGKMLYSLANKQLK